jgi:predicted N-acyltransferase
MRLDAFYALADEMREDIVNFTNGEGLSERLYDSLFSYYCGTNEMPYSVAKARTGDPYEWIDDRFTAFIEKLVSTAPLYIKLETDGYYVTDFKTSN